MLAISKLISAPKMDNLDLILTNEANNTLMIGDEKKQITLKDFT